MNNTVMIAIGVLVVLAVVFLVIVARGRKKLSGASMNKVIDAWNHALRMSDPARRVIEGDKVLDLALGELGFTGTLGDKLKKAGPKFSDVNAVWNAHKLRNTLAHEAGATVSDADASRAMRAFEKAIADLSK